MVTKSEHSILVNHKNNGFLSQRYSMFVVATNLGLNYH